MNLLNPNFIKVIDQFKNFLVQIESQLQLFSQQKIPQEELLKKAESMSKDDFFGYVAALESVAKEINAPDKKIHLSYAQEKLVDIFLRFPASKYAIQKPRGYAGDYQMIEMFFDPKLPGKTLFEQTMHLLMLQLMPVVAHQNRIRLLVDLLSDESQRIAGKNKKVRILSVGSGPAQEIRQFIKNRALKGISVDLHCVDFDPAALSFSKQKIEESLAKSSIDLQLKTHHHSVKDWLDADRFVEVKKDLNSNFDFIYCAGLFDYLQDRVCKFLIKELYALLDREALLVLTNVHPCNNARAFMDYVLDWSLIYRDEKELKNLANFHTDPQVVTEATGANIFLLLRKNS